jgi:hypothetical protein
LTWKLNGALDRGLYLRFNADVARRANSDEKRAVFRVNREMPVYVTLDDAEHPLLGDHSLANQGGRDWAALSGNTACTLGIVGVPSNCHAKVDALVTFAGRLGFALDRVLLYGKGGTAFAAPPPLGDMAHQPVDHNLTPVDVYFGRGPAILTFQESPIRKAKRKDVTELRGIAGSCDRPGLIAYLGGPHFFPRVAASITLLN